MKGQFNVYMRCEMAEEVAREAAELDVSQGVLVEKLMENWQRQKEEAVGKVPEGFWVEEGGKRLFVGKVGKKFYVSGEDEGWTIGPWQAVHYWEKKQKEMKK